MVTSPTHLAQLAFQQGNTALGNALIQQALGQGSAVAPGTGFNIANIQNLMAPPPTPGNGNLLAPISPAPAPTTTGGPFLPVEALTGLGFTPQQIASLQVSPAPAPTTTGQAGGNVAGSFGTGPLPFVPTDALAALFPYIMAPYDLAFQGAQLQNQLAGVQAQANASMFGAQAAAQANVQSSYISAQAQLQGLQASLAAQLQEAQFTGQIDVAQFNATMQQAVDIQNQMNRMEVARLASSTGLRDALTSRNFVRGLGPQAEFGSAMLAGPLQELTYTPIAAPSIGATPTVGSVPAPNLPALTPPNINVGSGAAMPNVPDFGNLIGNLFGGQSGGAAVPAAPVPPTHGIFQDPSNLIPTPGGGLQAGPIPGYQHGGTAHPGERGVVGEAGPEIFELNPDGTLDITPLRGTPAAPAPTPNGPLPTMPIGGRNTIGVPTPVGSPPSPSNLPPPTINPGAGAGGSAIADPGQTGMDIQNTPGFQALMGNIPQGFPGNQTFDLPEYGLSGIPGPAQAANLFLPGVLTPQEQQDILDIFGMGLNVPPSVLQHIISQFTPGSTALGTVPAVGF